MDWRKILYGDSFSFPLRGSPIRQVMFQTDYEMANSAVHSMDERQNSSTHHVNGHPHIQRNQVSFESSNHSNNNHVRSSGNRTCCCHTGCKSTINRRKSKHYIPLSKLLWLAFSLIGLAIHSAFVTMSYMEYETSTETTIGMPSKVDPPATSVCFSLWDLVKKSTRSSKCLITLLRDEIEECEKELLWSPSRQSESENGFTIGDILDRETKSPIDLMAKVDIREPPNQWLNNSDVNFLQQKGYVKEFYKGPYRCVYIESKESSKGDRKFRLDRLTTGYPRARYFSFANFNVNHKITSEIVTVRFYVSESGTYPRGSVTLPVVANISRQTYYIISYRKIETQYLQYPYSSKCIDYSNVEKIESKEHCIEKCVEGKTISQLYNTVPFDQVIFLESSNENSSKTRSNSGSGWQHSSSKFVSSSHDFVLKAGEACQEECPVDCFTRTLYTTLSESSMDSPTLTVSTRFEEPETIVRYTPKFDFQAYIIYEAGVFSIWFSASIFHSVTDIYFFCRKFLMYMKDIMVRRERVRRSERRRRPRGSSGMTR